MGKASSHSQRQGVSVIVPMRNERDNLGSLVSCLMTLLGKRDELILVDGESSDGSLELARDLELAYPALRVLISKPGRAMQMNLGALSARNPVFLFLHADTVLSPLAWAQLVTVLEGWNGESAFWGRFDVRIVGQSLILPLVAWMMNWRSRLTRIATGDQALFVSRSLFLRLGAFPEQALMEDVAFCSRLRRCEDARFLPLPGPVLTSGRRWDEEGAWATVFLMWRFRYLYWRGVSAEVLAAQYREIRGRGKP